VLEIDREAEHNVLARAVAIAATTREAREEGLEDRLGTHRRAAGVALQTFFAVLVVDLALLRVGEHLVGVRDVLEHLFGFGVAGILVGVVLDGELAVRSTDGLLVGITRNTEQLVIVLAHGGAVVGNVVVVVVVLKSQEKESVLLGTVHGAKVHTHAREGASEW